MRNEDQPEETETVAPAQTTTEVRQAVQALGNLQVASGGNGQNTSGGAGTSQPSTQNPTQANPPRAPAQDTRTEGRQQELTRGDMQDMFQALAAAFQVREQPSVNVSSQRLTTRDVKLPSFMGSKDENALHIDQAFYLPLIEWVKEARTLLRASGLPETQKVFAIFNALSGPARRVLMMHGAGSELADASADQLLDQLVACIPDYSTFFTTEALNMRFRTKNLLQDIEKFGLLLSFGDLPVSSTHFWYQTFTNKLRDAQSDLLTLATSMLNMPLHYRPNETLPQLIARAIDIVKRLQQANLLQSIAKRGSGGQDVEESSGTVNNGRNKRKGPSASSAASKRRKNDDGERSAEHLRLAREYDRCEKCGYYVPPDQMKSHVQKCNGNSKLFATRMGKVAKMVASGKADQVNNFPAKKKSDGKQ